MIHSPGSVSRIRLRQIRFASASGQVSAELGQTTGESNYWRIEFEADGKKWSCKDNFHCMLKGNDKDQLVVCRVFHEGGEEKMEVICPTSSNCIVSLESTSIPSLESRPVYVIGHRCNNPEDIGMALNKGANAIECDLQYDANSRQVFVNHDREAGTTLSKWLTSAKQVMSLYPSQFALIIFDCKFAACHDDDETGDALVTKSIK